MTNAWRRKEFIWYVSTGELRSRQMTTVLGNLWHLLNPALQIAIYYVIFAVVLEVDRGVDNFILFLTVGVLVFAYSQKATAVGARSIVSNGGLIRSISFPRAVLPITTTCTETLAMIPGLLVIAFVAAATGADFSLRWVALVPVIALQLLFNTGAAFVAARATTHLRDIEQILPFVFRLLFYASGVIFSVEEYTDSDLRWLFYLNPLYCIVTAARWAVMGGVLDGWVIMSLLTWSLGLLVGGFLWFRAAEATYGQQ